MTAEPFPTDSETLDALAGALEADTESDDLAWILGDHTARDALLALIWAVERADTRAYELETALRRCRDTLYAASAVFDPVGIRAADRPRITALFGWRFDRIVACIDMADEILGRQP